MNVRLSFLRRIGFYPLSEVTAERCSKSGKLAVCRSPIVARLNVFLRQPFSIKGDKLKFVGPSLKFPNTLQ